MASSSPHLCVFSHRHQYHLTDHEAFPHMTTNDDEYDGYYIPKGTVVLGSAWQVRNDYFALICIMTLFA